MRGAVRLVGLLMGRLSGIAGIIDFFVPAEVLSSVLLVFTLENVLDHIFGVFVPADASLAAWVVVYVLGVGAISMLNYASADEDELEDLSDDFEDL